MPTNRTTWLRLAAAAVFFTVPFLLVPTTTQADNGNASPTLRPLPRITLLLRG
jgi:hypothetical protein